VFPGIVESFLGAKVFLEIILVFLETFDLFLETDNVFLGAIWLLETKRLEEISSYLQNPKSYPLTLEVYIWC